MRFGKKWRRFASPLALGMAVFAAVPSATSLQAPVAQNATCPGSNLEKQIAAAEAEAAAKPKDPRVLLRLASLYHQQGDFKKSLPLLEQVITLQPHNPAALRLLGVDRFHAGHAADALGPLNTVAEVNPKDSEAKFYLGLCYLALDRDDEAEKAFDQIAAQAPADVDELYLLTRAYSGVSSAMLSHLASLGEDSYRIHQVHGEYFDLQNNPEEAIKEFEKAVELRPDLPSLHYVLGSAYWKHSQLDRAAAEFRRAIELNPRHFMAHYKLGMVLLEQNNRVSAAKEFRTALNEQPGLIDAYLGLGNALYLGGEYDAAVSQLKRHIQLSPQNPTPHYLLFQIYRRQNKPADADRELATFKDLENKAKAKNLERRLKESPKSP